jgi:hypothetical protein
VALDGDLRTREPSGDVDRGGEVEASDRPCRNGHAVTRLHQVGQRMALTCPASSDRWARAEDAV